MHKLKASLLALSLALTFATDLARAEKHLSMPDWALEAAKTEIPKKHAEAKAIVLLDEHLITVDAQSHATERRRFVIRIQKTRGSDARDCTASYDVDAKLYSFNAWTLTSAGKQLQAMPSDFIDVGALLDNTLQLTERIRVLTPPGADPGSVVACEVVSQVPFYISEKTYHLQSSIPQLNQNIELDLPAGMAYADAWSNFKSFQPTEVSPNHLRWEVKHTSGLDLSRVHAAPSSGAITPRLTVKWGAFAAKEKDEQWKQIGQWMEKLNESRPVPNAEITAKVHELTDNAPDLYTKLQRITDYLQKNIRYFIVMRGIGGLQAHPAADIYRVHYGDCKDKTTILIAMLQVIGVKAHYLAVDTERGINPDAPSLFGNHMITAIELPDDNNDPRLTARVKAKSGKTLLIFDPTDEWTPVGLIRGELQGAYGNLGNGDSSQILLMPILKPETAGNQRKGKFLLSAEGTLAGDLSETFTGDEALNKRVLLKYSDEKKKREVLEKRLTHDLPGLNFTGYEFSKVQDLDKPLELSEHFSTTNYVKHAGPLLLVRPRIVGTHVVDSPDILEETSRKYPIELGHPGKWHDEFDVQIPEGYVVDELPEKVDVDYDFASYHAKTTSKPGLLHYERDYTLRVVELAPERAMDLHRLEGAIMSDEKSTAVLKKQ